MKFWENVLCLINKTIESNEVVTDHDINEWLDQQTNQDDEKFNEFLEYLKSNNIVSKYDSKKDTYIYYKTI